MTALERDQLRQFLRQALQRPAPAKDPVAAQIIQEACAQHPDALYLLVQHAMATQLASPLPQDTTPPSGQSVWGAGLMGAVAGTAVGLVAGSWLLPDMEDLNPF